VQEREVSLGTTYVVESSGNQRTKRQEPNARESQAKSSQADKVISMLEVAFDGLGTGSKIISTYADLTNRMHEWWKLRLGRMIFTLLKLCQTLSRSLLHRPLGCSGACVARASFNLCCLRLTHLRRPVGRKEGDEVQLRCPRRFAQSIEILSRPI
jgi:hypothetical protein